MTARAFAVDSTFVQRAGALYLPLMAASILAVARRRHPRRFAACLLGFLWTTPALLLLQLLNLQRNWWNFPGAGIGLRGMPLELYAGWVILWGILPTLAFPRLPLAWVAAIMAGFDMVAMPLCGAVVRLGPDWRIGEAASIVSVLLPGLCLARWTLRDTHLALRAALQVATSGLLFLFLIPEVVFALRPGLNWGPLFSMPDWQRQLALLLMSLFTIPGVGAVMEFAQRGRGTPIPYDPPRRLVTSGIYRYLANPMQLSCTLVMLLLAAILRNPGLLLSPAIAVIYSAGIARWDERQDLAARFGNDWRAYRNEVRDWLPRWLPYHAGPPARLYLASTCGPCSQLARWFARRTVTEMEILPAESLQILVERMTYDPADGSAAVSGIRAMGRALGHLHLGWALVGTAMRLPGIWQAVQLLMDVSGFGPRRLACSAAQRTDVN
jgi:protein-S-isoprenylcysteine O-methyltransferase Ste14